MSERPGRPGSNRSLADAAGSTVGTGRPASTRREAAPRITKNRQFAGISNIKRPIALLAGLVLAALCFAQDEGRIMAPVSGAAYDSGPVRIIASAPAGKLLLDGNEIAAEAPFPNVLLANISPPPGEHVLRLTWEAGQREVRFHVGPNPPPGFSPYREHPPIATECTQCHGLSRRGRFRFSGGCFSCHQQDNFSAKHTHPPGQLDQCGMCHNAHGATTASFLIHPKDIACKLCHN